MQSLGLWGLWLIVRGICIIHWNIMVIITETEMLSFWWNFHHWLHWKLSFWQLSVQPVMKISSKRRHFRFSDAPGLCYDCLFKLWRIIHPVAVKIGQHDYVRGSWFFILDLPTFIGHTDVPAWTVLSQGLNYSGTIRPPMDAYQCGGMISSRHVFQKNIKI